MGYVIFLLEDTPNRRGRPYCYPPSEATGVFRAATGVAAAPQRGANPSFATEELGEVVCPNNNESLREKFFKNLFQNLSKLLIYGFFADDTNEIGQRRAIPQAESYVR